MRILLKILLFPVVLVLTVLVAFCRFFCLFSGMCSPDEWTASSGLWCWRGSSVPTACHWQPPG